jgi:hypothetical protein
VFNGGNIVDKLVSRLKNKGVQQLNPTSRYAMKNAIVKNVAKIAVAIVVTYASGAIPMDAYAQSNQPLSRAQVRAELVQLENAGYNPGAKDNRYPEKLQAAEAKVSKEQGSEQAAYGSPGVTATQSGGSKNLSGVKEVAGTKSLYFGH